MLLGRKAVTSLDSILKSRNITLSTKVYRVKALFFPVVMYGCFLVTQLCLFAIPWASAHQAFLSFTISQTLLKLISIESVMPSNKLVMPSNYLICSPSPAFNLSENQGLLKWIFASGGQSIGAPASASVPPMSI